MNSEINETILHGLEGKNPVNPAREEFLNSPINGLIFRNAMPAIASMLFMAFYQMTDGIMVGQRLGSEALASINILYPIISLLVGLAVMIGVGGNARIAVLLGENKDQEASKVLSLISITGLLLGVIGGFIVIAVFDSILNLLGTTDNLGIMAGSYLKAIFPFWSGMILIFILEQSVRNDGKAGFATAVMACLAVLNIILDYIFLFPLNMGIAGAAAATGLSQSIGAGIFIIYFIRKTVRKSHGLRFSTPGGGFTVIKAIVLNGSSEFLNSIAMGITTFLFNRILLSRIGSEGVAAFALIQYFTLVAVMIYLGLNNGSQPIISYNYGAGLSKRVRQVLYKLLIISLILGLTFFMILNFFSNYFVNIFINETGNVALLTINASKIISYSLIVMPIGIIGSMFFTSLENAKYSMVISISRSLIFIVIGLLIFPAFIGDNGIWITPLFAETASALITAVLILRWRKKNKIEHLAKMPIEA